jgi:LemA protein
MALGLLVVVVLVLLGLVSVYNRLVGLRNRTENALRTIDVQLKQRCDLIPKVVDAVRGHMAFEQSTLERLTTLRQQASAPGVAAGERLALDAQIAGLLHGIVARAEAYPGLKSSDAVLMLQRSLNEVESQIAAARRTYNAAATAYNTRIETIPTNLVAGVLGFTSRPLFEASADERAVPFTGVLRS